MAEKEEMMFEGIGNELIWTCGFIFISGIVLFVFLLIQEGNEQEVHPQQVNIITYMDKHSGILLITCTRSCYLHCVINVFVVSLYRALSDCLYQNNSNAGY